MSNVHRPDKPNGDEEIVSVPRSIEPGTPDGVGEHVVEGPRHDGVRRMESEFAELDREDDSV